MQKAIVVANIREEDPANEIKELLFSTGAEVISVISQKRETPDPSTYLGKGKIEEVKSLVQELKADIVVIDDEITPRQQRNLEDYLGMGVLDRVAVILDIFALHAHTAEGKLQVETAQLEYNLTRMIGLWNHLERLGGGIGTRGPGESQLETDRRLARNRLDSLKKKLKGLSEQRKLSRSQRLEKGIPSIALAGYTNAGKSTLLTALTGSHVSAADRLFETLDPITRRLEIEGHDYTLTDTVGFIRNLPHQLVEAFGSTLEETIVSDLILLVADASLPEDERDDQIQVVEKTLESIGAGQIPRLLVLNKIDQIDEDERRRIKNGYKDGILISAKSGDGLDELLHQIEDYFLSRMQKVDLVIPYSSSKEIARLYSQGEVLSRKDMEDGVYITALLPKVNAGRYQRFSQVR